MKKFLLGFVILIIVLVTSLYIFRDTSDDTLISSNDTTEFIESYELFNNTPNGDKNYLELNLNKDAVINISNINEVIDIINNEDAVIYFGFSTCPWCRNMIETLLDVSSDNKKDIYYLDIENLRNKYIVNDGELEESIIADDAYYELLELLDEVLDDYIVYDGDNEYDTGTKRLYAPTVLTVKGGEILDIKIGTLDEVDDPYIKLTDEQYDLLYMEFDNMFKELDNNSCDINGC